MRTKLTDAAIRSFKPREIPYPVGDSTCPGLCIRITPKGVKTFAFAFRNKATRKVEWLTLGRYPDLSLARAREQEKQVPGTNDGFVGGESRRCQ